ncbi:MucR family transcriptional regulator [Sphingobium sp. CR2-8]|uniref:MucR family transcriptional regulator n=1 Tax=Sphingobium sp. CR2-8 TaxID=1306534 RepID=UPI002DB8320D|nr:MucR family transcriptional regulator [Sphingobium sp. CR2-8]MEC3911536.1 MucR family transcriptional regulator [Sphingobium sp. CR2-8]
MTDETAQNELLITLTSDIVAAHVANNSVSVGDVANLITSVHSALTGLNASVEPVDEKPKGAVSVRASIKQDHLVSMIDGKPYKMLKRHIQQNGYTPESYRETFGLPKDYPLTAPSYSAQRKELAVKIGLGRKPGQSKKADAPAPKVSAKKAASKPVTPE